MIGRVIRTAVRKIGEWGNFTTFENLAEFSGTVNAQIDSAHKLSAQMVESAIRTSAGMDEKLRAEIRAEIRAEMQTARLRVVEAHHQIFGKVYGAWGEGKKIRCVFMVADTSLWDVYAPIYDALRDAGWAEVDVVAFGRVDIEGDKSEIEVGQFFRERDISVHLEGFEGKKCRPLEGLDPDLVFYTLGSTAYPEMYRIENVSLYCRTCYLSYGFLMADEFDYQFGQSFHHNAWTVFASTKREMGLYGERTARAHANSVLVGYPKFDLYRGIRADKGGRKTVIYAPHWTVGEVYPRLNLGSFEKLADAMCAFMEERAEIDFIFKPHPNLAYAMGKLGAEEEERHRRFTSAVGDLPNVRTWVHGDYFEMFVNSSGMITDSVSFLAEYLPSGNPLLYLDRPDRAKLADVGEAIIGAHYSGFGISAVREFVDEVVVAGHDPKLKEREAAQREQLNIGEKTSSGQILDYIKQTYKI